MYNPIRLHSLLQIFVGLQIGRSVHIASNINPNNCVDTQTNDALMHHSDMVGRPFYSRRHEGGVCSTALRPAVAWSLLRDRSPGKLADEAT